MVPLDESDLTGEGQESVDAARKEGADYVVALSHLGSVEDPYTSISIINKMKEEKPHHETYLQPDEVARICDVTKNTLWRWDRDGYLKPVHVGRRLFYKKSDVDKLLNGE